MLKATRLTHNNSLLSYTYKKKNLSHLDRPGSLPKNVFLYTLQESKFLFPPSLNIPFQGITSKDDLRDSLPNGDTQKEHIEIIKYTVIFFVFVRGLLCYENDTNVSDNLLHGAHSWDS